MIFWLHEDLFLLLSSEFEESESGATNFGKVEMADKDDIEENEDKPDGSVVVASGDGINWSDWIYAALSSCMQLWVTGGPNWADRIFNRSRLTSGRNWITGKDKGHGWQYTAYSSYVVA